MPLVAVPVAGWRYPVARVLNIVVVGPTALVRPVAYLRQYDRCGLGGHVALGVLLNAAITALVAVCFFTGLDPTRDPAVAGAPAIGVH